MKIQSEHQKQVTLEKIKELKLSLLQPKKEGVSEILYNAARAQIKGLIEELTQEVKEFDERVSR